VKHALAGSAYRDRVAECAAAVEGIRKMFPAVESLRDVSPEQFQAAEHLLSPVVARRARHIVTEDARVNRFVEASERGDLEAMGKLMVESHRSLQHDYEVSCEELDFLAEAALGIEGVYGARMTGGGFGGPPPRRCSARRSRRPTRASSALRRASTSANHPPAPANWQASVVSKN
jgi:galactokinase